MASGKREIRFDGRVAIITGAGTGMGRTYALAMAARGASVIVNDLGVDRRGVGSSTAVADAVVDEIRAAGGKAIASYVSVASKEGGEQIAAAALDAYGRIDVLVNNAAVHRLGPFETQTLEDIRVTMSAVLEAAFYVTQPVYRFMRKAGYGRVLMTSSSAGVLGLDSCAAYGAAKAGLVGLMNVLAIEGGDFGIQCNTLMPGAFTVEGIASNRGGIASDVPEATRAVTARAWGAIKDGLAPDYVTPLVLYLCSEQCRANQRIYSAIGGRYARAFVGMNYGWQGPTSKPAAPEEVDAHFNIVEDLGSYYVPEGAEGELKVLASRSLNKQG